MKQILTYISPTKDFNEEHKMAVKIQIDNSLSLGWDIEDVLLITNFKYEYNGIQSHIIEDDNYCQHNFPATKIYVIDYLFRNGLIKDEVYWYHDFDCFQLNPFGDVEFADVGLTNYGRMPRLCSASIFFKKTAEDIFKRLKEKVDADKVNEEVGIMRLLSSNPDLKERVSLLNITYAFHKFNLRSCYKIVDRPIKAVHFHLTSDKYDFYVRGINKLNMVLIPERLIKIFNQNGF